jgi:hypothetical protein
LIGLLGCEAEPSSALGAKTTKGYKFVQFCSLSFKKMHVTSFVF